jgi:hypothetical protein
VASSTLRLTTRTELHPVDSRPAQSSSSVYGQKCAWLRGVGLQEQKDLQNPKHMLTLTESSGASTQHTHAQSQQQSLWQGPPCLSDTAQASRVRNQRKRQYTAAPLPAQEGVPHQRTAHKNSRGALATP